MKKIFLKNLKRYIHLFVLLFFLIVLGSFISILPIKLIEGIVDLAEKNAISNINKIILLGVLYLVLHVAAGFLKSSSSYLSSFLQGNIGLQLKNDLYNKLLTIPLVTLERKNSVEITNSLIEDTEYISENLVLLATQILISVTSFIIGLVIMLNIDYILTLIILPCGLVTSISARIIQKKSYDNISQKREKSINLWKIFSEGIRGVMPIRLYRYGSKYREMVLDATNQMKDVTLKQKKLENINYFFMTSLFMISIGIILIATSIFVVKGSITIGALTAILMYNHMLIDPLVDIMDAQQKVVKLIVSVKKISSIFIIPDDINISKKVVEIDKIEFDNVSYSYNGQNKILNNINFEASSPTSIQVIGKTGSGKSTFVNLISGLYTPTDGEVIYYKKGQKVNGIPNTSYLIQDGYLFDKSIVENIKIANPDISNSELEELIKLCCLEEVLEMHGDNAIGENGNNLSGGEKKRVRIAQMLANRKPDIYIFDELKSALDQSTATKIINNILSLKLNKICIFVEHSINPELPLNQLIEIDKCNIKTVEQEKSYICI